MLKDLKRSEYDVRREMLGFYGKFPRGRLAERSKTPPISHWGVSCFHFVLFSWPACHFESMWHEFLILLSKRLSLLKS